MKNRNTIYFIMILIIGLTVISGCAKKPSVGNQNTNVTPTPSLSPSPSPQETPDIDTSDWKTYRNEEYGFEVKYPWDWKIKEIDKYVIGLFPPARNPGLEYNGDIWFSIRQRLNNESVENIYNGKRGPELFKSAVGGYQRINIGGKDSFYFKDVMGLFPINIVIVPTKNWFIEINVIDNIDVFNTLIKTLSFN